MVPSPPEVSHLLGPSKPKCCAADIGCWPTSVVMIGFCMWVASHSRLTACCGRISSPCCSNASDLTARHSSICRHQSSRFCAFSCRRSEEHTSELQSLMRISYAVFCLKKKKKLLQYHH